MSLPANAQAMMVKMLGKPLFVALRIPADLSGFSENLADHLKWATQCEQRGELFASGPFVAAGGVPGALGGMSIFRASSEAQVRKILADDPFIRHGVYTAEIKKWVLMEGGMTLSVRFSDQSYVLR
ncbi:YciI family protein [Eoetvoesiella caeni]|uniref:YCII-related domain-containing protein n=1 Tax=Eoetvoesiella caeni TaxID=645616 RepID=A0A366H2R5_9BURK|nr:YciI family protein [Eoetvoesiella caeni]MCI2810600.1 YciI family protein [Eoetvoesiella caeni]NYT56616.1 hypothetical protein [Eoetvoesiella caeni]RBP36223.1 hypothetical protein DFR37_11354 [Eoetvoesiella caeni]